MEKFINGIYVQLDTFHDLEIYPLLKSGAWGSKSDVESLCQLMIKQQQVVETLWWTVQYTIGYDAVGTRDILFTCRTDPLIRGQRKRVLERTQGSPTYLKRNVHALKRRKGEFSCLCHYSVKQPT